MGHSKDIAEKNLVVSRIVGTAVNPDLPGRLTTIFASIGASLRWPCVTRLVMDGQHPQCFRQLVASPFFEGGRRAGPNEGACSEPRARLPTSASTTADDAFVSRIVQSSQQRKMLCLACSCPSSPRSPPLCYKTCLLASFWLVELPPPSPSCPPA